MTSNFRLTDLYKHPGLLIGFTATAGLIAGLYLLGLNNNNLTVVLSIAFGVMIFLGLQPKYYRVSAGIGVSLVLIMAAYFLQIILDTYATIYEWDFLAFYIYGKSGADGLLIYDPASFTDMLDKVQLPFEVTKMFHSYVIEVGVCYPPTTMLLLAPMGMLDYESANIIWRSAILLFLILDIFLAYKLYKVHDDRFLHFLFVMALVLILPGTTSTVFLAQTNFFLLFFLLLVFHNPDHWRSGVFLALAMIVKPIVVVLGIYYLIHWKWRPLLAALSTGVLIILATIAFFGFENFTGFFTLSPMSRIPYAVYIEDINQSMFAVLSRISLAQDWRTVLEHINLVVAIGSILLIGLTVVASRKLHDTDRLASFLIFLPLSLLIYPGCLSHYAVQLVPLLLFMIGLRSKKSILILITFIILLKFSSFSASLLLLLSMITYALLRKPIFGRTSTDNARTY